MHRIARSCVLFLWIHTLTFVKTEDCTLQQFLKSSWYNEHFDTSNLADSYPSGTQVRVGCVTGYSGFFKLICEGGTWAHKGTDCQPRSCGHPGDAQFADFHLTVGDDFVFGSQVTYTCHKGYQMVSRKDHRTCMAGGWDGTVPVCEAQSCPSFDVADNVVVNGDIQDATYGNVVRFNCKSNAFVLYGSSEMYCDEHGEWVGARPRCEAIKCTTPAIENGYVPGDIQRQRVYNEHEVLHFACNDQYRRTEGRPSKCAKVGEKAEFSPTPACEQIKCKLDQLTPAGTTYDPAYRNVFIPGETLRVRCGDKYYFSDFRETSAEVTCKKDGEWSRPSVCKEVICERRHPHVSRWSPWGQTKLDETVGYTCEYGYKKTSATGQATCTRDGWMPNPLCEEIRCNRVSVENAVIDGGKLVYKYEQEATYSCKEGYRGRPTRTCRENGWVGNSKCTEIKCNRADVKNADIVGNKSQYKYKEKAYYRCHKGFEGGPIRICKTGRLQAADKTRECTVVRCEREDFDYADPRDGRRWFKYDEMLEYTCINGSEGGFTRTCGEKGWTGSTSCSTCPKAQVINGFVLPSSTDSNTVYYACNEGFKRFTKGWQGEAKCEGRAWVGLDQCIEENKCGEIPAIPNGATSHQQTRVYEDGQHAWIGCKEGYQPRLRNDRFTCQGGKWTSTSSLETVCEPAPGNCKPPPVVENAVVDSPYQDEYKSYSYVYYKCRDDYTIGRENALRCRDGNWEEKDITCSPRPATGDTKDPDAAPATGHTQDQDAAPALGDTQDQDAAPATGHTQDQDAAPAPGHTQDQDAAPALGHTQDQDAAPALGDPQAQ